MNVVILVPVLGRPERVEPLVESIQAARGGHQVWTLFLVSRGDTAQWDACREVCNGPLGRDGDVDALMVAWPAGHGDYARKMNYGARRLVADTADWMFFGADDLRFEPGWLDAVQLCHERTNACVVGTNDLGNPAVMHNEHSTHTLVSLRYLECGTIDEPGKLLHEGYDHNFCNPPEAPVWMDDCTFKPMGELVVGDMVVGWERIEAEAARVGTPRRSLCYSEVLAVGRRTAPLVRVFLESGREFDCTPDHRWLNALWSPGSAHAAQFVTPRVGRTLLHVVDEPVVDPALARTAGWLAGIYDGEGSGIYVATQSTRQNPQVVDAIREALDAIGANYRWSVRRDGIAEFVLNGGRQSYLDFLLRVQPVRSSSLAACILGWRSANSSRKSREPIGARRFGHKDKVVAVEPITSKAEVVSLTTSSGNYIAHGYASRNCDNEFVGTAIHRQTYAQALDARVEHLHPNWRKGTGDATYNKGQRAFDSDRALFRARAHLWGNA